MLIKYYFLFYLYSLNKCLITGEMLPEMLNDWHGTDPELICFIFNKPFKRNP